MNYVRIILQFYFYFPTSENWEMSTIIHLQHLYNSAAMSLYARCVVQVKSWSVNKVNQRNLNLNHKWNFRMRDSKKKKEKKTGNELQEREKEFSFLFFLFFFHCCCCMQKILNSNLFKLYECEKCGNFHLSTFNGSNDK